MNIRVLILSTSKTRWFAADVERLRFHMEKAKGVVVDTIDIRLISDPKLKVIRDSDGDRTFDWQSFRDIITTQASGYNAVILHVTRQQAKWLDLDVNGSYRRDPDEFFECWISADNGQRSENYWGVFSKVYDDIIYWSEWLRMAVHELTSHGFERFFYGYETNYTHDYDYGPNWRDGDRSGPHILPELITIMDATEWTRLRDLRDQTKLRLIDIIKRKVQDLIRQLRNPMIDGPIYPLAPEYWRKVTQRFGTPNPRYQKTHPVASERIHNGDDFGTPIGTPIYAPVDGAIAFRGGDHPTMGGFVYFDGMFGKDRRYLRFLHLSKAMPVGRYKQGDIIGYTGNSGDSDGPHLHIDVWKVPINSALIRTPKGVRENLLDPVAFFAEQVDGIMAQ